MKKISFFLSFFLLISFLNTADIQAKASEKMSCLVSVFDHEKKKIGTQNLIFDKNAPVSFYHFSAETKTFSKGQTLKKGDFFFIPQFKDEIFVNQTFNNFTLVQGVALKEIATQAELKHHSILNGMVVISPTASISINIYPAEVSAVVGEVMARCYAVKANNNVLPLLKQKQKMLNKLL